MDDVREEWIDLKQGGGLKPLDVEPRNLGGTRDHGMEFLIRESANS